MSFYEASGLGAGAATAEERKQLGSPCHGPGKKELMMAPPKMVRWKEWTEVAQLV